MVVVRRRLAVIVVVTLAVFGWVTASSSVELADSDLPQIPQATVSISARQAVSPLPGSYFGLSTEYWSLPLYARDGQLGLFERVVSMLRTPGDGPLVLRIGGDSSSRTFWDPRHGTLPRWAYTLTPRWTRLVRRLVRRLGVRLIIDLNLVTGSPGSAAMLVRAAEAGLPRRSIIGFEIGNEPDIYDHWAWRTITHDEMNADTFLPDAITRARYVSEFRAYADAVRTAAPGVALLGPALAQPGLHAGWVASLIASHERALTTITAHRYSYAGCARRSSPHFPTIARVLSRAADVDLAASVAREVRVAHRAGLRFRLDELNSVNCGGRAGVSNSFATALWAPGALFDLRRVGVDGVNVHIRADTINAPFALRGGGLVARPLLYGLLLFVRTVGGSHPALLPLHLRAWRSLGLEAWAVRSGGGHLHVLLIDEGRRSVQVTLRLPWRGPVAIQRLLAPSAGSLGGATLGGRWLGRDGRWHGAATDDFATPTRRGYVVTVRHYSAALLSARLTPGALTRVARGAPRRIAGRAR